jgi:hypothetical protein
MNTPLLTPAVLLNLLAIAQPALAGTVLDDTGLLGEQGPYGEAFKSYAVLAQQDDEAARFKLATLYYTAPDDVRAALWFLMTGGQAPDDRHWAVAA